MGYGFNDFLRDALYTYNPFAQAAESIGHGVENILDFGSNLINDISGHTAATQNQQALNLSKESQSFNEQYSMKALQQQEEQFKINNATANKNIDFQKEIAEKNLAAQVDAFNAQLNENEITRKREDTAYQRQVADLKAAGFSPLMASNGAGAAAMSVGSAPQYDGQAVATAQGSAIQLAREYAELRNMAQGQYLSRRQEAINSQIGARQALAELATQRKLGFENLALQSFNLANTLKDSKKKREQIDEQIRVSKNTNAWMEKYGYRNRDMWNTLIPIISEASKKLGISVDSFTDAISNLPNKIQEILGDNPSKEQIINSIGNNNSSVLCANLSSDDLTEALLYATMPLKDSDISKIAKYYYPKLDSKRKNSMSEQQFENWIKSAGWKEVLSIAFGLKI